MPSADLWCRQRSVAPVFVVQTFFLFAFTFTVVYKYHFRFGVQSTVLFFKREKESGVFEKVVKE